MYCVSHGQVIQGVLATLKSGSVDDFHRYAQPNASYAVFELIIRLYRSRKQGDRDTFTSPGLAVTLLSFKSMMIEVQRPLLARIERR